MWPGCTQCCEGPDCGRLALQASAGGLVSARMGGGDSGAKWIVWPGVYVEEGPDRDALTAALAKENYVPVYLDANIVSAAFKRITCSDAIMTETV